jgi:hypothetical protein
MVTVKYLPLILYIVIILGVDPPGERCKPVEIVAAHSIFCGMRLKETHLVHLFIDLFSSFFSEFQLRDPLLELFDL